MGNQSPKSINLKEAQLYPPDKCTVVSETNKPLYGDIQIIRDNICNKLYAHMTKSVRSQQQFEMQIKHYNKRKNLTHDHIVKLINFNSLQVDEFCSIYYKIFVLYEYLSKDLQQEIQYMIETKEYFQECDLWTILECVLTAMIYLKQNDIICDYVTPQTILISDDWEIKLAENFQQNSNQINYQFEMLNQQEQKIYMSPQVLKECSQFEEGVQSQTQLSNPEKSGIFSLGATLIEAATLKNIGSIYNYTTYTINENQLQQKLYRIKETYSYELARALEAMVDLREEQRPNIDETVNLVKMLAPKLHQEDNQQNLPRQNMQQQNQNSASSNHIYTKQNSQQYTQHKQQYPQQQGTQYRVLEKNNYRGSSSSHNTQQITSKHYCQKPLQNTYHSSNNNSNQQSTFQSTITYQQPQHNFSKQASYSQNTQSMNIQTIIDKYQSNRN